MPWMTCLGSEFEKGGARGVEGLGFAGVRSDFVRAKVLLVWFVWRFNRSLFSVEEVKRGTELFSTGEGGLHS